MAQMARTRTSRHLPQHRLPESIVLTSQGEQALARPSLIVSAVPTQFVRPIWQQLAPYTPASVPIISLAKGIETGTLLRPTQIIARSLHPSEVDPPARPLAALSGPSVADELARRLPATVCVAANEPQLAVQVQRTFTTGWFRVYTNDDLVGVELAGATKNVIALAAGILDGLAAGINAKSALLARGLAEIARLGVAMGGQDQTFYGLAGVGDLATTCFSPTGRNRTCGEHLGKGKTLKQALAAMDGVVEGVPTTRAVVKLAQQYAVQMPITFAVYGVLFEDLDPVEAINRLMRRQLKAEHVR